MYFAKEGFGTGFQSLVLPIYSFARLDRTRRLYQGLLRNIFNWLPSLITSQSSTKPTYWIQLQICPKLCQWSHSRGQIFGLNIQIRQWWMKQDDMTLSITKLVGHCLIHFSLEARSVFFLPPSLNRTLFCPTWNWRRFLPDSSPLWTVKLSRHHPALICGNQIVPPIFISTAFCSIF